MYCFVFVVIALVGLVQIPILVDILRAVFPGWKLRRTTHLCVTVLLVSVMSSFFIIGLSYYLLLFLPLAVQHPFSSISGLLHLTFALWIWINLVVNYFMAVFIHPGTAWENEERPSDDEQSIGIPTNGMVWNLARHHYCSVCRDRVAYMDHHCPFTGNCVGLKNYSYYLLSLLYGALGLGYALWMSFSYFNQCVLINIWWIIGLAEVKRPDVCTEVGLHANVTVAIIGGFYVLMNMSIIQILMLLADLSSYDILKNITKLSVFRLAWHRMRGRKYKEPGSRLNVMLLQQRPSILWFLIPRMNTNDSVPMSVLAKL